MLPVVYSEMLCYILDLPQVAYLYLLFTV